MGVELAGPRRRERRASYVEALLGAVHVEQYDLDVARSHARLLAHVRRAGEPRGAHDLLIAATAVATDRALVAADAKGFSGLPGVDVREAG